MRKTIIITGVGGLVGSAAAEHFHGLGYSIFGIDNDSRGKMLHDPKASTGWNIERLKRDLGHFSNCAVDVRDAEGVDFILKGLGWDVAAIIHTAAQTAHEGSLREDFSVNAGGTLNMLDAWRQFCPEAVFVYTSTIKVYGGFPNTLGYVTDGDRYDLPPDHRYHRGFDETVPIDQSGMSSFFGRSKAAADLYVQEFAAQFGLKAACLRASCITGGMHSASEAHGFLGYLMKCAYLKTPYRVYGFDGFQVRDQIHANDLVSAIAEIVADPKERVVYNIGGGRANACSVLEAIGMCERLTGNKMAVTFHPARTGDHAFWITDNAALQAAYPNWKIEMGLTDILEDILDKGRERWTA
jgi:CDP-paratose 2-epimerase